MSSRFLITTFIICSWSASSSSLNCAIFLVTKGVLFWERQHLHTAAHWLLTGSYRERGLKRRMEVFTDATIAGCSTNSNPGSAFRWERWTRGQTTKYLLVLRSCGRFQFEVVVHRFVCVVCDNNVGQSRERGSRMHKRVDLYFYIYAHIRGRFSVWAWVHV